MRNSPYRLTSPCVKCPFRTDVKGYLTKARVQEILVGLRRGEFPCHETLDYESGEGLRTDRTAHCAGALILLEKLEQPSQMMRISERLGLYDARRLAMGAPVFDSFREMIDHHGGRCDGEDD